MARRQWFDVPATDTPLAASLLNDLEARKTENDYLALNVKDPPFNAVGNGAVDDTLAIQTALTAAAGKTLYFPAGIYNYATGLVSSNLGTRLVGAGKGSSELNYTGTGVALTWGNGTPHHNQFAMENIRIRGTLIAEGGLRLWAIQNWVLYNCDFVGFAGSVATSTATTTSADPNLTLVTPTTTWVNGMFVTGVGIPVGTRILSGAGTATMVMSKNATASAGGVTVTGRRGYGVLLDEYANCGLAVNTDVRQNDIGWMVGFDANLNVVLGGQVTDNGYGIYCYDWSESNAWIGSNVASQSYSKAIFLEAGQLNRIDGCYFEINASGAGTASVWIGNQTENKPSHYNKITNNYFVDNNVVYAVRVDQGTENLIVGNQHTGTGATAFCRASTVATDTIVRDNAIGFVPLLDDAGVRTGISGPNVAVPTVASAATVTLPGHPGMVNISGSTTITTINARWKGEQVTLVWAAGATFDVTDGSNLKLSASITTFDADDTLTLMCDGTNWFEMARSVN